MSGCAGSRFSSGVRGKAVTRSSQDNADSRTCGPSTCMHACMRVSVCILVLTVLPHTGA